MIGTVIGTMKLGRVMIAGLLAAGAIWAQSVQSLTTQIQRTPTAALYAERGSLYLESGDARQAIADFDRALERDPVNPRTLEWRARAHAQMGRHDNAITDLSGALALNPSAAELYLARADAYAATGDMRHAVADREEALRLSPEQYGQWMAREKAPATTPPATPAVASPKPEVVAAVAPPKPTLPPATHYQRSRDLISKGAYAEALAEINQAIELDAKNPLFYNTRGYGYYLLKDYKRAIADYDTALRLDPIYLNAVHNRAAAKKSIGDTAGYEADRQREAQLSRKK
jgi:tetratricopeptide (TPR) repeat protein